jgi:hypothetical protein
MVCLAPVSVRNTIILFVPDRLGDLTVTLTSPGTVHWSQVDGSDSQVGVSRGMRTPLGNVFTSV